MIQICLLLPCVLLLCVYVYLWVVTRRERTMLKGLPTHPTLPFIGNAHQCLGSTEWLMQETITCSAAVEKSGLPFVFWIGPYPCLFLSNPEDIRVITNTTVEKPYFYSLCKDMIGDGLITAPGSIWKRNIKRLGNLFNQSTLDDFQEIFNHLSRELVQKLKTEVEETSYHSLLQHISMTTLLAICQTTLGIPNDLIYELITPEYEEIFQKAAKCLMRRVTNIIYYNDTIYRLTPAYRELMRYKNVLHGVLDKILTMKRLTLKNNRVESPKHTQLIDILLAMQEEDLSVTDEYIKSELLTVLSAGYDTVATAILFCFLMLGSHRAVQEKVYAEVNSFLGTSKKSLTKKHLSQMTYTEAVIKETLRVYPPVPVVIRAADRDINLKSCTIPTGTCCFLSIWGTNRLRKYWGQDANTFRPDRWLEQDCPENAPYFIPYSYGKRSCLGKGYSMRLMKTVLAYCVQEFIFESDMENMVLAVDITARPVRGVSVKIRRRES